MAGDHDGSQVKTYAIIMGILAVLTLIEVYTPQLAARNLVVPLLMAIAVAKAAFVVAYYMHVKYEPNFIRIIPAVPLVFVILLLLALVYAI